MHFKNTKKKKDDQFHPFALTVLFLLIDGFAFYLAVSPNRFSEVADPQRFFDFLNGKSSSKADYRTVYN
jgi:hypothetical protein